MSLVNTQFAHRYCKIFLLCTLINSLVGTTAASEIEIPQPAELGFVEEKLLLEAIAFAQEAVRDKPNDAEKWGKLGHVYLVHGWEQTAVTCYRQAITLAPNEFRWHYFLGRLTAQQQPQEAIRVLTRAMQLKRDSAPAHLYLASAMRILGRLDEAKQHLKRAKQLQPENPFSDLWLAEIALQKIKPTTDDKLLNQNFTQQVELARTHLQHALQLNPAQSEAHAIMAQLQRLLGNTHLAQQHARAARQPSQFIPLAEPLWWEVLQQGVTAPLYAQRGKWHIAEGDFESAVAEFQALISNAQKDVEVWIDYSVALFYTQRYNEAFAALASAQVLLRNDPDLKKYKKTTELDYLTAQVHYYFGRIYYKTGRNAAAIRECQKALQYQPTPRIYQVVPDNATIATFFSDVYANLGMLYEETNQLDLAIEQYQNALRLTPKTPALHRDLAVVLWKKRNYAKAESHYKVVVNHDKTDIQAVYRLGLIFLMQEHYVQAARQFKKVLELDDKHAQAYGALGIAHQKLGNIPEAIAAFEKVLQLDPANQNALQMLRQLKQ